MAILIYYYLFYCQQVIPLNLYFAFREMAANSVVFKSSFMQQKLLKYNIAVHVQNIYWVKDIFPQVATYIHNLKYYFSAV